MNPAPTVRLITAYATDAAKITSALQQVGLKVNENPRDSRHFDVYWKTPDPTKLLTDPGRAIAFTYDPKSVSPAYAACFLGLYPPYDPEKPIFIESIKQAIAKAPSRRKMPILVASENTRWVYNTREELERSGIFEVKTLSDPHPFFLALVGPDETHACCLPKEHRFKAFIVCHETDEWAIRTLLAAYGNHGFADVIRKGDPQSTADFLIRWHTHHYPPLP